jgi:hypothetical protein
MLMLMLKIWLQGGKKETMFRTMYDRAMQGMHEELLHMSTPSGLTYLADKLGKKRIHHKMDHLVCFVGGMLALGAYTDPQGLDSARAQRDLQTAKVSIALTPVVCCRVYSQSIFRLLTHLLSGPTPYSIRRSRIPATKCMLV